MIWRNIFSVRVFSFFFWREKYNKTRSRSKISIKSTLFINNTSLVDLTEKMLISPWKSWSHFVVQFTQICALKNLREINLVLKLLGNFKIPDFLHFCHVQNSQKSIFKASKMFKVARFKVLYSPKLISRKIWKAKYFLHNTNLGGMRQWTRGLGPSLIRHEPTRHGDRHSH